MGGHMEEQLDAEVPSAAPRPPSLKHERNAEGTPRPGTSPGHPLSRQDADPDWPAASGWSLGAGVTVRAWLTEKAAPAARSALSSTPLREQPRHPP